MAKDENEIKSQIADWLIYVLGQTDITNNSLNQLIDNEYDNYVMKRDYEKKIAELKREVEELKANQTPTRKKLLPKNWDKYNLADKLRYRNSQVKEALIRLSDMNEMETMLTFQLQHQQNQKAIECLKEIKSDLLDISNGYWKCFAKYGQQYMTSEDLEECLKEFIDNKIKELEGEKE